ncbi:MAG: thioesterase family protein [Bacteroidota bacterium]|nr:thioesterase family protein [Bacteroidota bacterium]MDP4231308.1 thioesterase family protein [Bacteroidota bacterium]MDP4235889.1 thioesterase family protein [Bacteroidota bacterium]
MVPEYKESDYTYTTTYRVRSHECDRQGVVHNSRYLEILEVARIEFCRDILRIPMDPGTFASHHKFFFVRNAINYFSPAQFDEELLIYTRIPKIGKTSILIHQIMNRLNDGSRVLECESVMVSVNEQTNEPKEIDHELRILLIGEV